MNVVIQKLGKGFKGRELVFDYLSDSYFDLEMEKAEDGWRMVLQEKAFDEPVKRRFTDRLLEDWLEDPILYGAVLDGEEAGFLELSHEKWNQRLRISNILVEEKYRGRGIGARLFAQAEKEAQTLKARAIVLETQSCNMPAIRFYLRMGMELIGFDRCAYTDEDIERKEVRMEFGKAIPAETA